MNDVYSYRKHTSEDIINIHMYKYEPCLLCNCVLQFKFLSHVLWLTLTRIISAEVQYVLHVRAPAE